MSLFYFLLFYFCGKTACETIRYVPKMLMAKMFSQACLPQKYQIKMINNFNLTNLLYSYYVLDIVLGSGVIPVNKTDE